jgi:hypothetical protein
MAPSQDSFREILSGFKKRLTQDELHDFQFATLEDVRLEMARIQDAQASRKEMMNMPRIQSFLEAMDQFGKVIEVFLNTSEFVAFVWGPLKFLLQVSSKPWPRTSAAAAVTTARRLYKARLHNTSRSPEMVCPGEPHDVPSFTLEFFSHQFSYCWLG